MRFLGQITSQAGTCQWYKRAAPWVVNPSRSRDSYYTVLADCLLAILILSSLAILLLLLLIACVIYCLYSTLILHVLRCMKIEVCYAMICIALLLCMTWHVLHVNYAPMKSRTLAPALHLVPINGHPAGIFYSELLPLWNCHAWICFCLLHCKSVRILY